MIIAILCGLYLAYVIIKEIVKELPPWVMRVIRTEGERAKRLESLN